jgi:hypothetical protein
MSLKRNTVTAGHPVIRGSSQPLSLAVLFFDQQCLYIGDSYR